MFSKESRHLCWKHTSGLIFSQIMKINEINLPIFKGIHHDRAYRYLIMHYLCFESIFIDWVYSPDIAEMKLGSRTFIVILRALCRMKSCTCKSRNFNLQLIRTARSPNNNLSINRFAFLCCHFVSMQFPSLNPICLHHALKYVILLCNWKLKFLGTPGNRD